MAWKSTDRPTARLARNTLGPPIVHRHTFACTMTTHKKEIEVVTPDERDYYYQMVASSPSPSLSAIQSQVFLLLACKMLRDEAGDGETDHIRIYMKVQNMWQSLFAGLRMARRASFYELKYNRKLFILTSKLVQFNEQFICTLCCEQRPFLAATSVLLFLISTSTRQRRRCRRSNHFRKTGWSMMVNTEALCSSSECVAFMTTFNWTPER